MTQIPSQGASPLQILLLSQDSRLIELTSLSLPREHFDVSWTRKTESALERLDAAEVLVIDLPDPSGFEALRACRRSSPISILLLSSRTDSSARISAFEMGADDFLCKPFLSIEPGLRIAALARRARQPSSLTTVRPLKLDCHTKKATYRGRTIDLTHREFELLTVLASEPGRNFRRSELFERVWNGVEGGDERRVDLYVSRVRAKLRRPGHGDMIRSIYGVGYRLEVGATVSSPCSS